MSGNGRDEVMYAAFDRLCISATGADAATYLHSQMSNDIASMPIGGSLMSYVLEPTGKIVALVRVTRLAEDRFLLDTDAITDLDRLLLERLNRFRIRVKVEFESQVRTCIALRSLTGAPLSSDVVASLKEISDTIVVDAFWLDGRAVDVIGPSGDLDVKAVGALLPNGRAGDLAQLEENRVRSGWPAMGREIVSGETLVAATGVVSEAVSFSKGCYPGQELVERMDSRGSSAPRTLRRIRRHEIPSANPERIAVGDVLVVDDKEIGNVTSVAGEWILAYVMRSVELGAPIGATADPTVSPGR